MPGQDLLVPQQRGSRSGAVPRTADVTGVTARALSAQAEFASWSEPAVDGLLAAMARLVDARAEELAVAAVRETRIGNVPDKTVKIRFSAVGVEASLHGRPAAGVLRRDRRRRVVEIATPVGLVLGLLPVTNPVATLVFKALIALKGRNALVVSPHHRATQVSLRTTALLREVLQRHGAPPDLLQCLDERWGRDQVAVLMRAPEVGLVIATGGAGVVRAAAGSGTPSIGVGPGNAPAWVAADADVARAAACVVASKSFDHGVICGSEQHVVADRSVVGALLDHLRREGAAVLSDEQVRRARRALFDPGTGRLRRGLVGQSAAVVAAAAGVHVPFGTRLLVAPLPVDDLRDPWLGERLAPLVTLRTVAGAEEALELCHELLRREGAGHTAVVHTASRRTAQTCAIRLATSRTLVNVPASLGCVGSGTGLTPSFTLGCGTAGGTGTTDNVSYRHLLNVVRLAEPARRSLPEVLRARLSRVSPAAPCGPSAPPTEC